MRGRFRLPMFVVACALVGLMALLATLQYRWLGQISDAERDRMRSTLEARATEYGRDFDRELTRAYLLFQPDFSPPEQDTAERMAVRFDRWQATARFPRLLKAVYVVSRDGDSSRLERLNVSSRTLEAIAWPASMADWREQLGETGLRSETTGALTIRHLAAPIWDRVPAIVVPMPRWGVNERADGPDALHPMEFAYAVMELDRGSVTSELLPALSKQHLPTSGEGVDYHVAVVNRSPGNELIYGFRTPDFAPPVDAVVDAAAELFQVRTQEFPAVATEVRRFSTFTTAVTAQPGAGGVIQFKSGSLRGQRPSVSDRIRIERDASLLQGRFEMRGEGRGAPVSIVVQQTGPGPTGGAATALAAATSRMAAGTAPRWRLMIKHRSGSLEAAVNAARRRNLLVSSSILVVLGASVGLLVFSARRAQNLARQQMEFVAAVSHELRTPLAVIRSAGENLADGVVHDDARIRKYGDLVRSEGRRLTEMVEQILEFAGIHSGQRGFALRPIGVRALIEEVVHASDTLIEAANIQVEYDFPETLPPVLGDEAALRRVFQNLVGNAVRYSGTAGWIGLRARSAGREVQITVADRGIGIAPPEQARIFEPFYRSPDVAAAQIQGAGLGLSLVKRIVDAHGGRIQVRSAPGAGSEFTVVLSAASGEPIRTDAIHIDSKNEPLRPASASGGSAGILSD